MDSEMDGRFTRVTTPRPTPLCASTPDLPRGNMDHFAAEWLYSRATFDEMEEHAHEKDRELLRAGKLYIESVADKDRRLCEEDWLHGLFTSYYENDMDEKVENLVEFVEHAYDLEDDPNHIVEGNKRRFIRETFHYVLTTRCTVLKQMLALIIIGREHDIQEKLRECTRRDYVEPLLEQLPGLADAVTRVPFNQINAQYYTSLFVRGAKEVYYMGTRNTPLHDALLQVHRADTR